jgi:hypothetical protein
VASSAPDPYGGIVRWALRRHRKHLGRWVVGLMLFPLVAGVVGAFVRLPPKPTTWDRVAQGLVSAAIAFGVVLFIVLAYALLVAPYEQRKALRAEAREATEAHFALEASHAEAHVDDDHFADLNAIAKDFLYHVEHRVECSVQKGTDWESFAAHFPDVASAIGDWNIEMRVRRRRATDLETRMLAEAEGRGIKPPQYLGDFIARQLLGVVMVRADNRNLANKDFPYQWSTTPITAGSDESPTSLFWDRVTPNAVVNLASPGGERPLLDRAEAIETVEGLFRDALGWRETRAYMVRDIGGVGGWVDLRDPLVEKLTYLAERVFYKHGNGCSRCN